MHRRVEIDIEEKVEIVKGCIEGRTGTAEASRLAGVGWTTMQEWIKKYESEGIKAFEGSDRNRAYSLDQKETAVRDYLSGAGSLIEICRKYQIRSKTQLRKWIKVYNSGGNFKERSGGSRMMKARKTNQEERIQIVKECLESGKDYGGIARKYQVSYQQVYTWVKKYSELGEAGLEDRRGQRTRQQEPRTPEEEMKARIAQLEHENYMLRMERDLLKKVKELERRDRWGK